MTTNCLTAAVLILALLACGSGSHAAGLQATRRSLEAVHDTICTPPAPERGEECSLNPAFAFVSVKSSGTVWTSAIKKLASFTLVCAGSTTEEDCNSWPKSACAWYTIGAPGSNTSVSMCAPKDLSPLVLNLLCPGSQISELLKCAQLTSRSKCNNQRDGKRCTWTKPKGGKSSLCAATFAKNWSLDKYMRMMGIVDSVGGPAAYNPNFLGCCPIMMITMLASGCDTEVQQTAQGPRCGSNPLCKVVGTNSSATCELDTSKLFASLLSREDADNLNRYDALCTAAASNATQCAAVGTLPSLPTRADIVTALYSSVPGPLKPSQCPKKWTWPMY